MEKKGKAQKKSPETTPTAEPPVAESPAARLSPGFKLLIERPSNALPSLKIAWRLTQEALQELREKGIKYPHLLLVISSLPVMGAGSNSENEHQRLVFPLENGVEFVGFTNPGRYKIRATIIWSDQENPETEISTDEREMCSKDLLGVCLQENHGRHVDFFNHQECVMEDAITKSLCHLQKSSLIAEQEIFVAEEAFAIKPVEWLENWTGWMFGASPKNSCDLLGRIILAFTIQPFIWLIGAILITAIRIFVLSFISVFGVKVFSWSSFFYPYTRDLNDIFGKEFVFWWQTDSSGERRKDIHVHHILFMPAIWGFILLIELMIDQTLNLDAGIFWLIWEMIVVGAFSISFLMKNIPIILGIHDSESSDAAGLAKKREALLNRFYAKRLSPIADETKATIVDWLPLSKRACHLWFLNIKSQFCRPFRHQ